jgi:hypothetical protein
MSDLTTYNIGLEMKKEAARRHVERVFPVTNDELRALEKLQQTISAEPKE